MKASDTLLVKRGLLFERSVRELLRDGLEAREAGRGAVPKTRADHLAEQLEECLKELRTLVMLLGAVGRGVIANQQLLVHWATRDESFGVNEDDLLAELQAVGAEGRAQVLDDVPREPVWPEYPNRKKGEPEQ